MTEDGRAPVQYVEPLPDTAMQRRMAAGHAMRLGHAENAVHVSADGVLWHKSAPMLRRHYAGHGAHMGRRHPRSSSSYTPHGRITQ